MVRTCHHGHLKVGHGPDKPFWPGSSSPRGGHNFVQLWSKMHSGASRNWIFLKKIPPFRKYSLPLNPIFPTAQTWVLGTPDVDPTNYKVKHSDPYYCYWPLDVGSWRFFLNSQQFLWDKTPEFLLRLPITRKLWTHEHRISWILNHFPPKKQQPRDQHQVRRTFNFPPELMMHVLIVDVATLTEGQHFLSNNISVSIGYHSPPGYWWIYSQTADWCVLQLLVFSNLLFALSTEFPKDIEINFGAYSFLLMIFCFHRILVL